ncbi:hypothetical protein VE04_10089, partial [Pseudogymnoascus sp. 24MN13]
MPVLHSCATEHHRIASPNPGSTSPNRTFSDCLIAAATLLPPSVAHIDVLVLICANRRMDYDLSKQSLWLPCWASVASAIDSPPPSSLSPGHPSVPEQPEDGAPAPLSPLSPNSTETQQRPRRDSRVKNSGRKIAQIVKLRPEFVEQYKDCHANVWPEVLKQIRECGIRDYSIFRDPGTNILFATFSYVGYGFADDMERMRDNPK